MSTGFVLGKFAPLHKGHQLLIETALEENEGVLVMIYHAPDVTDVPLPVRAGWIGELYPEVERIEAWDGPLEVGHSPEMQRMHEEYILARLAGRKVDRFYSSEFYGEHVSKALGAVDRRIDEARRRIPISGTAIRNDPFANRSFLHPRVYRDLVTRVLLVGAPSTGKSTLAEALARRNETQWMPEYGREYWQRHQQDRRLTPQQLLEIAQGHVEGEEQRIGEANRYLFVDTDASTTRIFARYYHGQALPELDRMAEAAARRYDLCFLCDDDIPYEDTWDRSGEGSRALFQSWIEADLIQRGVPFIRLLGDLQQRLDRVAVVLAAYRKYRSLAESLLAC
jgi:NadR type nicotinamide-nucleotide adenylyltransferase